MIRRSKSLWIALILVLGPATTLADDRPSAASSLLAERGLKLAGQVYVLPGEAEVRQRLHDLHEVYLSMVAAQEKKDVFDKAIASSRLQSRDMQQQIRELTQRLDLASSMPDYNRMVSQINNLNAQLHDLRSFGQQTDTQKAVAAPAAVLREQYMQGVLDLRALIDQIREEYKTLSDDIEVRKAFVALNGTGKPVWMLGPSRSFQTSVKTLERVESTVLSDSVTLTEASGVHWVNVTLNGKVTRPMVFDTGASSIVLPATLAAAIGLRPGPTDPVVQAQVADGGRVVAHRMTIPSVRVGRFTVNNVECIVMPPSKKIVTPLLGQTFHKHFTYRLTPESGTLVMSRVRTEDLSAKRPRLLPGGESGGD